MKKIAIAVCEHYEMLLEDMFDKRKTDEVVRLRYMAMYIAYRYFGYSYAEIGRFFNKKHETCMHGIKKMSGEIEVYPRLKADFFAIRERIYSNGDPHITRGNSKMQFCNPCDALTISS